MIIRTSRPDDAERMIQIWRDAVDATHGLLSAPDRAGIEEEVIGFLPVVSLWLAADDDGRTLGFMFLDDAHVEALFVDPACHRQGIGSRLLQDAQGRHAALFVDVNAANTQARAFYSRHDFVEIGRSDRDSQGRPYPLLHLPRQRPCTNDACCHAPPGLTFPKSEDITC